MNQENSSSSSTRKSKFTPKAPKRKPPTRPSQPRSEADSAAEDADSELLLKHFRERHTNDKKSSVRVAFGPGAIIPTAEAITPTTTTTTTTTSQKRKLIKDEIMEDVTKDGSDDTGSPDETMDDVLIESNSEDEAYKEPWNYDTYYPTALPMRRPNSGNPVILDESEFGEAAYNKEENANDAAELGFLDESERESFLFFQLPLDLPLPNESSNKGKEPIGQAARAPQDPNRLKDLKEGRMGKLLVYNSGKTKLKLGETLYYVYPGSGGGVCEHVMAMNGETKDGCFLGQVEKHVVVSVDVDSILDGLTGE